MSDALSKPLQWTAEVLPQLRHLQATISDLPGDERVRLIGEALRQELQAVDRSDRKRFLQALLAQAPAGEGGERTAEDAPPGGGDPVAALLDHWSFMTDGEKRDARRRLGEGGVLAPADENSGKKGSSLEDRGDEVAILKSLLELPAEAVLPLESFVGMANKLVKAGKQLDRRSASIWEEITKELTNLDRRHEAPLRDALVTFLQRGEPAEPVDDLQLRLEAILFSIVPAAKSFVVRKLEKKLDPAKIRKAAKGSGFLVSDNACWREYEKIYQELSASALAQDLVNTIGEKAADFRERARREPQVRLADDGNDS